MSSETYFANLLFDERLKFRQLHLDDAGIAADLVRKVDVAACGESTTTIEELAGDIESAERSGGNAYGLFRDSDLVVSAILQNELIDGRGCFIDVFADPEIEPNFLASQIALLLAAAESYTHEFLMRNKLSPDFVKTALYENDQAFLTALQDSDYEHHRTYWRLRIDHADLTEVTSTKTEVEIRSFVDSDMSMADMHELSTVIFNDHYDFSPMNFEDWQVERTSGVNSAELWRIAYVDDTPVGYCWRSKRFDSEGFSYIASIGVTREYRGKGIAKALLLDAFSEAKKAGLIGTLLHCDSTNPNGATELYVGVGMRVDRVYPAYRKLISV